MNLGGLAVLFLVVVGASFGLYLIAAQANMDAPVDTFGGTTSIEDNTTREEVTKLTPAILPIGVFLAVVVSLMILFGIIIYLAAAHKGVRYRPMR